MNREIFKLCRQYWRLDSKAELVRGTCINKRWYAVVDDIFDVLDKLESLGVEPVTFPYLERETPEGQLVLGTLS